MGDSGNFEMLVKDCKQIGGVNVGFNGKESRLSVSLEISFTVYIQSKVIYPTTTQNGGM